MILSCSVHVLGSTYAFACIVRLSMHMAESACDKKCLLILVFVDCVLMFFSRHVSMTRKDNLKQMLEDKEVSRTATSKDSAAMKISHLFCVML